MNDFIFKWMNRLNEGELKELKKHTKLLPEKLKNFSLAVIKRFLESQENGKERVMSLDDFVGVVKVKEGRKYLANFVRGVNKIKGFLVDFLVVDMARKDEVLTEKTLFQAAKEKNFSEGYFYHLQEWEKKVENKNNRSFDYQHDMFRVNYYRFFHADFQKAKLKSHHNNTDYTPAEVLAKSWNHLQIFRLIAQIRLACEIEYQKWTLEDAEGFLSDLEDLDIPLIEKYISESIVLEIYFKIYQWVKNKNFADLEGLKKIIPIAIQNIQYFSEEERVSILVLLNNCIGRMLRQNEAQKELKTMLADIAIMGFENDIFGEQTNLELNLFLGFYDTINEVYSDFVAIIKEKHIHKLPTEMDRNWAKTYIEAREAMQSNQFYNAITETIQLGHFGNYALTTRKYVLLLECTYELNKIVDTTTSSKDLIAFSDEAAWLKIIKNIEKTFSQTINYTNQASAENEHIALFNFATIASALFLETHKKEEIETMIETKTAHAANWLRNKLKTYAKNDASDLDNRLKSYSKIVDLILNQKR